MALASVRIVAFLASFRLLVGLGLLVPDNRNVRRGSHGPGSFL